MINLFLAMVWFLFGVGFLFIAYMNPERDQRAQGPSLTVMGWIALAMCGFNIWRWWSTRPKGGDPRWQEHMDHLRRRKPPEVVDPTFDFSDKNEEKTDPPPPA